MPRLAPHLARELARGSTAARLPSTLDLPLQRAVEDIAATALRGLPDRASLAILVADAREHEVRALSGGDRRPRPGRRARPDAGRALPGSALKPMLYALAFEAGIAAPETLLADLPRRFGTYAPENFDRGFAGRITVADALRQSLNLPAVALLSELGPLRFASALKAAGATPRLPPGTDASLPLALGGLGITLRELAGLYATLGQEAPPRRCASSRARTPRRAGSSSRAPRRSPPPSW
ncbi:penicillin-binding transpeptidase domain-containing protein [Paeniroseomonas aquatica]|uniref:penicillin-binding transpeptidase domain-containing protein n=1 Tax=Paeniroseomonas aquatica TaxID=373043 RepID=UPI003609A78A